MEGHGLTRLPLALFCAALALAPARAEAPRPAEAPPQGDAQRYAMTPIEGGFLRLDRETGAVSYCTVKDGVSACRASAEERAGFEDELARLRRENAELKSRLAATPPPRMAPSEEEFERALSFTERFMRRMMRIFKEEAPGEKS